MKGIGFGDEFGIEVALSGDGNMLIVGAPSSNATGIDKGYAQVYKWSQ